MLKSKLGVFFVAIYVSVVFYAIVESKSSPPEPMDDFALLILTAPFSFLVGILFDILGLTKKESGDSLIYIYVFFGGLVNASIFYLIGCFFHKAFNLFSSSKK